MMLAPLSQQNTHPCICSLPDEMPYFVVEQMQVAQYAIRFLADWVSLELLSHVLYFNSIAKHRIGLQYRPYGLAYGATEMGKRTPKSH